ncbi:hypothetical protein Tco_0309337 [Tanacetum coccineum]
MNSPPNYKCKQLLDIDDYDLPLTLVLRQCNIHVRETTTTTQNPDVDNLEEKSVRIILGHVGIVQVANLYKQSNIHEGGDESVLSTQEYIRKVVDDIFHKNTVPSNGSGVGGSGMLDEEEIMKLLKEE